ncbi:MAG: isocitrate/isopropylmalate family dehydrogenase, partial [Ardenticatenaceae bacterium]
MKSYQIAVYPGDGIGVEVIEQTVRVLEGVQARSGGFVLHMTHLPWGAEYWVETGQVVPANYLEILRPFDAILLGALGDPARIPDHITLRPIVEIRQHFDQYACVRPARLLEGVPSRLVN